MTWFRDYVYIPLGGGKVSRWKVMRNVLIVFFLSGLWHGANWTFIIWGLYSALLFIPSIWRGRRKTKNDTPATLSDIPHILFTFLLVALGWVVFRSADMTEAMGYILRMFTAIDVTSLCELTIGKAALLWCLLLVVIEWLQRMHRHVLVLSERGIFRYAPVRWLLYYVLLMAIVFFHGEEQTFIYFQF